VKLQSVWLRAVTIEQVGVVRVTGWLQWHLREVRSFKLKLEIWYFEGIHRFNLLIAEFFSMATSSLWIS